MNVRQATLKDAQIIASYNQAMALETEDKHLPDEQILNGVRNQIDNPERGYYLVVENASEEVMGCLGITYEWSDWRNGLFLWIQSVFIAPEHRRLGAFKALYDRVIEIAEQDATVCGVRLYVEKDNNNARATYLALGMHRTEYDLLEIEV